jgi:hypothetical protein
MNTRDKIHSAINEHIDIEDTYAYFLTREKSSFSVGTVTLDDFEEWTDSDVADLTDSIMEKINPELNENQQVVLDWLKDNVLQDGTSAMCSVFQFGTLWELRRFNDKEAIRVDNAYCELSNDEQFQVLAAYAEWGMKNEQ